MRGFRLSTRWSACRADSPAKMFVADSLFGAMEGGDVDSFCVRKPEVLAAEVRMTIVWHDPPVSESHTLRRPLSA